MYSLWNQHRKQLVILIAYATPPSVGHVRLPRNVSGTDDHRERRHQRPTPTTSTLSKSKRELYHSIIPFTMADSVSLKNRIKQHYDFCSTYYQSLWVSVVAGVAKSLVLSEDGGCHV
jgi:hypothetical protein